MLQELSKLAERITHISECTLPPAAPPNAERLRDVRLPGANTNTSSNTVGSRKSRNSPVVCNSARSHNAKLGDLTGKYRNATGVRPVKVSYSAGALGTAAELEEVKFSSNTPPGVNVTIVKSSEFIQSTPLTLQKPCFFSMLSLKPSVLSDICTTSCLPCSLPASSLQTASLSEAFIVGNLADGQKRCVKTQKPRCTRTRHKSRICDEANGLVTSSPPSVGKEYIVT